MVSKNFRNIVSVSWGDHLLFGEGDGRLTTPKALKRRMKRWCKELGACSIHWLQNRTILSDGMCNFKRRIKRKILC